MATQKKSALEQAFNNFVKGGQNVLSSLGNYFSTNNTQGFWGYEKPNPIAQGLAGIQQTAQTGAQNAANNFDTLGQNIAYIAKDPRFAAELPKIANQSIQDFTNDAYGNNVFSNVLGRTVGGIEQGFTGLLTTPFTKKSNFEKGGDILGGIGATLFPGESIAAAALNPVFNTAVRTATGQKTSGQNLLEDYSQGIEFGNKFGPLSKASGSVLSPFLSKFNPIEIKTATDVVKRLIASGTRGGTGFAVYGATEPAKSFEERLNNIKDSAIQGAIFDMGLASTSMAGKKLLSNVKTVLQEMKQMTPEEKSLFLQQGGIKIGSSSRKASQPVVGEQPPIEPPVGVSSPQNVVGGQKELGLISTAKESQQVAPETKPGLKGSYTPTPLLQMKAEGEQLLKQIGFNDAKARILSAEPFSRDQASLAMAMVRQLEKEGKFDDATEIINAIAPKAKDAGQGNALWALWAQKTPQGMIAFAKRLYEEANKFANVTPMNLGKRLLRMKPTEYTVSPELEKLIGERMKVIQGMQEGETKNAAMQKLIEDIAKPLRPSAKQYLDAYRYQNMLSGVGTQQRNLYSNSFQAVLKRPLDLTAEVALDKVSSLVRGTPSTRSVSEIPTYLNEMRKALIDTKQLAAGENAVVRLQSRALDAFKQAYKDGSLDSRLDMENLNKVGFSTVTQNKLPRILQVATGLLRGVDAFFTEALQSAEAGARIKRGYAPEDASAAGLKIAKKYLFTSDLDLTNATGQGKVFTMMDNMANLILQGGNKFAPLRWFVPFVKTVNNVAKENLEATPGLGLLNLAGNADKQAVIAKQLTGSVAMLLGAIMAGSGRTTWLAPTDQKQKEYFYAQGHKPLSININGVDVPFTYFGTFGLALAIPAALKYYNEQSRTALTDSQVEVLGRTLQGGLHYFTDQTFLAGIGQFVNMLEGNTDATTAEGFGFTAGQLIPIGGFLGTVSRVIDPVFRNPQGFTESFFQNVPGFSKNYKAYTDPITGEPSKRELINTIGLPWAVGFTQGKEAYQEPFEARGLELQANTVNNKIEKLWEAVADGRMSEEEAQKKTDELIQRLDGASRKLINLDIKAPEISLVGKAYAAEESQKNPGVETIKTKAKDQVNKTKVQYTGTPILDGNKLYYLNDSSNPTILDLNPLLKETTGIAKYEQEAKRYKTARDVFALDSIPDQQKEAIYKKLGVTNEDVQYDYFANQTIDARVKFYTQSFANMSNAEVMKQLLVGRTESVSGELLVSNGVIDGLVENDIISSDQGKLLKGYKFTRAGKNIGTSSKPKAPKKIAFPSVKKPSITPRRSTQATIRPLKPIKISTKPVAQKTARLKGIPSFTPKRINLKIKSAPGTLRFLGK